MATYLPWFLFKSVMKRKLLEKIVLGILVIGAWGVLYSLQLIVYKPERERASQLQAILSGAEGVPQLDEQKKSENCHIQGPLPDHECTPGTIFPDATKEKICVSGYTKTVRNVSSSTRKKVFALYGISYPQPFGAYEVDHLVPLALGGNNEIANLFPEARDPFPGFKEKDVVEVYLQEEVCAGRVLLNVAQERIAENWMEIYDKLEKDTINRIKNKYRSWTN